MNFPLCHKYKLLRQPRVKSFAVVSTSALYELLGPKRYEEVRKTFRYASYCGPRPDEIEEYLQRGGGRSPSKPKT